MIKGYKRHALGIAIGTGTTICSKIIKNSLSEEHLGCKYVLSRKQRLYIHIYSRLLRWIFLYSPFAHHCLFLVAPGSESTVAHRLRARHDAVTHWLPATAGCEGIRKRSLLQQQGLVPSRHAGNLRTAGDS